MTGEEGTFSSYESGKEEESASKVKEAWIWLVVV